VALWETYYDNFSIHRFLFQLESFLGDLQPFYKTYYVVFIFCNYLIELGSFLGGLQPFCKIYCHVFNFCNYLFELETMLGKSTTYWRVLNGFFWLYGYEIKVIWFRVIQIQWPNVWGPKWYWSSRTKCMKSKEESSSDTIFVPFVVVFLTFKCIKWICNSLKNDGLRLYGCVLTFKVCNDYFFED
jgi:hypothetical protein